MEAAVNGDTLYPGMWFWEKREEWEEEKIILIVN